MEEKIIYPKIEIIDAIYFEDDLKRRLRLKTKVRKKIGRFYYLIPVVRDSIVNRCEPNQNELLAFINECYCVLMLYKRADKSLKDQDQRGEFERMGIVIYGNNA